MPMNYSEMEQAIRSLQESRTINEKILSETRRSEDRLHRMVLVVFGVVGVIFAALMGYNTWNINRVYNEITDRVNAARSSLETQYNTALTKQRDDFNNLKNELLKVQNSSYANAFIQLADIRQSLLDLEGALMNAIVAFHKATESGSKEWIAALERMDTAIRRSTMGQKHLPNVLIWEVRKILTIVERMSSGGNDQSIKLAESLKAHEA